MTEKVGDELDLEDNQRKERVLSGCGANWTLPGHCFKFCIVHALPSGQKHSSTKAAHQLPDDINECHDYTKST
jgi:hypothetical protein